LVIKIAISMPYIIADELFSTKDAITARCRAILSATPDEEPVEEAVAPFLFELFQYHDEWPQKAEGGVRGISTQTTPHGTRCFVLVKLAGDQIDISFPHAIRLIPSSRSSALLPQALRDFRSAARTAIKAQINEFRDSALQQRRRCPYTGETLNRGNCAVDHTPPETFDQLLYDFCRSRSLNPLRVAVGSEGGTVAVLEDAELLAAWQAYHHEYMELRLISKVGNLQLPKVALSWSELWL
jgi:hypothetical protein